MEILPLSLSRFLATSRLPLKYKLFNSLKNRNLLNYAIPYPFHDRIIEAPADQWYFWKNCGVETYQVGRLKLFSALLNDRFGPFDLLDLGADIGIVSNQISYFCPGLQSVIAAEPNPLSFSYLEKNLKSIGVPATAMNVAISDSNRTANLIFDEKSQSDHSGYINLDTPGNTLVQKIDSIYNGEANDLAIKIDIEGQELAAIKGGEITIRSKKNIGLFLEIHRNVVDRTNISPENIFSAVEKIRPCEWFLAESDTPKVDRNRRFFEQFPHVRQHDVIGFMKA